MNVYGESAASASGNGATIVLVPDAPINLADNSVVTTQSVIGLTWSNGPSAGGSSIIDYRISYDQSTGEFVHLESGVIGQSYTTTVLLTPGAVYKFKVEARNSVGYSLESAEVEILAAQVPDQPSAPTTTQSGPNMIVKWSMPYNGASVVFAYQVEF